MPQNGDDDKNIVPIFKPEEIKKEPTAQNLSFKKYKFNNRPKPDPKQVLIITCFSEFGCESIAINYCIPRVLQMYPSHYVICVGWYGREYLYRHLVDEYWEINQENMWLRDYAKAFHHDSKNLEEIELKLSEHGVMLSSKYFGAFCLSNTCLNCNHKWAEQNSMSECPFCKSNNLQLGFFSGINYWRKLMIQVPRPSIARIREAKKYLKDNPVGIFARGRATYGRNLTPEFYVDLIKTLEDRGYNPIWLGEKQSTLPCPVSHIIDFSRQEESRDLELTLAIVSQLQFTIQFFTASTRLSAMMGVPFILFESPDQIVFRGQEGIRLALTSSVNKKKLVLSEYSETLNNPQKTLRLATDAIAEIEQDNWNTKFGLLDNEWSVKTIYKQKNYWEENVANY